MKIDYSKDELEKVVKESNTYREVLRNFNRNDSSTSYRVLKRKLDDWGINTNHFLSPSDVMKRSIKNGKLKRYDNDELFQENSNISRHTIKKRLIDDNILEYKCVDCENKGEWLGKSITLILDHINGVNNDNRVDNLRFLCPNCNATKPTHCVGSVGLEEKIEKIDGRTVRKERPEIRKVKWPSKNKLKILLKNSSYTSIGREYGVSDNAVRKWAKVYKLI